MGKAKKEITKESLKNNGMFVFVNGKSTENWEIGQLPEDGSTIEVFHYSDHLGMKKLKLSGNTTLHEKGIIKKCFYYMIATPFGAIPYHRFLYAWFNGIAHVGMDISHKDGNSKNNNLSNLIEETHKENLARRKGAINQYGKKKVTQEEIDLKQLMKKIKLERLTDKYLSYIAKCATHIDRLEMKLNEIVHKEDSKMAKKYVDMMCKWKAKFYEAEKKYMELKTSLEKIS